MTIMRVLFFFLFFLSSAFYAQAAEIFDLSQSGGSQQLRPPDISEYDLIGPGMMIAPDGTEKKDAAALALEEQQRQQRQQTAARKYTMDEIRGLYNQGKFKEIVDSLQLMIEAGQDEAFEIFGIMHRTGQGVEKNPEKAFDLLLHAAEKGRALSQHYVGIMHYTGEGVLKDEVKALMWIHIAIVNYKDPRMKTRAQADRDSLYATLTRREKDRAQGMARDWLTKRGEGHLMDLH